MFCTLTPISIRIPKMNIFIGEQQKIRSALAFLKLIAV